MTLLPVSDDTSPAIISEDYGFGADELGTKRGTPEWWLNRLACALQDRRWGRHSGRRYHRDLMRPSRVRPGLELLHDYLIGDPPLIGYAEGWGEHFRRISRLGRLNIAELTINSKSARMSLRGFRTAAVDDEIGDKVARDIMRANNLAVIGREIHDYQLWAADGYGMVQPLQGDDKFPVMTSEDPRQTITAHDAQTGRTLAALKIFREEWDQRDIAHLYLRQADDTWLHFPLAMTGNTSLTSKPFRMQNGWFLLDVPAPLPRCPIVRFANRGHRGEYERHLDTLDRINDQIMNKVVIAKVQAFRQMVLKGLPDKQSVLDPTTGTVKEEWIDYSDAFVAEPGSLWRVPKDTDIWESQATDLGPLRLSIKDDLQSYAAATQTSLPAITPDAAQGSAEGAALMREEEVFAVEACRDYAGGGWAEMMATAFAFMNDTDRSQVQDIEALWGPIERWSLNDRATAASQAKNNLPSELIWRDVWGYDPAEIPNIRQMAGRDLLSLAASTTRESITTTPGQAPTPAAAAPPVTFQAPGQPAKQPPTDEGQQGGSAATP